MSENKQSSVDEFVAVGMGRYREASATLVAFGEEVEKKLQSILTNRAAERWKPFVPNETKSSRSTRYWSKYPLLNAKLDGFFKGTAITVSIAINWYESEGEYPFYCLNFEPEGSYSYEMTQFKWRQNVLCDGRCLRINPCPEDFNLKRDFGVLLDEAVRFLGSLSIQENDSRRKE